VIGANVQMREELPEATASLLLKRNLPGTKGWEVSLGHVVSERNQTLIALVLRREVTADQPPADSITKSAVVIHEGAVDVEHDDLVLRHRIHNNRSPPPTRGMSAQLRRRPVPDERPDSGTRFGDVAGLGRSSAGVPQGIRYRNAISVW